MVFFLCTTLLAGMLAAFFLVKYSQEQKTYQAALNRVISLESAAKTNQTTQAQAERSLADAQRLLAEAQTALLNEQTSAEALRIQLAELDALLQSEREYNDELITAYTALKEYVLSLGLALPE